MAYTLRVRLLLLYHLVVCVAFWLFASQSHTPSWAGSLTVFALFTVQFTWSFTVGAIVGPSRKRRRWLFAAGLLSFMPLWFTFLTTWVIWHFVGHELAELWFVVALGVLCFETVVGLAQGIICHNVWMEP